MCEAHRNGVIHRDIKPANIMIPRDEAGVWGCASAKLSDLGLARFDSTTQALTLDKTTMGTPGFMAPEQARDSKNARKPADIFSMGATLYALLAGQLPFPGNTFTEVLMKTVEQPHQPLSDLRPDVSDATQTLINRCLQKQPEHRFVDAFALRDALKVCREVIGMDGASQVAAGAKLTTILKATEVGQPVRSDTEPPPAKPQPQPESIKAIRPDGDGAAAHRGGGAGAGGGSRGCGPLFLRTSRTMRPPTRRSRTPSRRRRSQLRRSLSRSHCRRRCRSPRRPLAPTAPTIAVPAPESSG